MHEVMKMKPGLQWRPKDTGYARAVRHLPKRTPHMKWNQPKRPLYIFQTEKLEEWSHLSSLNSKYYTLNLEQWDLMLSQWVLVLVQLFLTAPHLSHM